MTTHAYWLLGWFSKHMKLSLGVLRVLRKNRVVLYDRISILFVDKILRKQTWKKLGRRSRKSIFFKLWHKMWHNYCHMTRSSCLYTCYILLVSLLYVVTSMTYTVVPTVRFMFIQVVKFGFKYRWNSPGFSTCGIRSYPLNYTYS